MLPIKKKKVFKNSWGRNFNSPGGGYGATQYAVSTCILTPNALSAIVRSVKGRLLSFTESWPVDIEFFAAGNRCNLSTTLDPFGLPILKPGTGRAFF